MDKKAQVEQLTTYMANFVSYIGKVLPDDIKAKIDELAEKEDSPLSKVIYQTMQKNQVLAKELNRPSCQDTGVLQFWVKCGTNFPLIGELEGLLKEAVVKATFELAHHLLNNDGLLDDTGQVDSLKIGNIHLENVRNPEKFDYLKNLNKSAFWVFCFHMRF